MFVRTILSGVCILVILVVLLEEATAKDYKLRVKRPAWWGSEDESKEEVENSSSWWGFGDSSDDTEGVNEDLDSKDIVHSSNSEIQDIQLEEGGSADIDHSSNSEIQSIDLGEGSAEMSMETLENNRVDEDAIDNSEDANDDQNVADASNSNDEDINNSVEDSNGGGWFSFGSDSNSQDDINDYVEENINIAEIGSGDNLNADVDNLNDYSLILSGTDDNDLTEDELGISNAIDDGDSLSMCDQPMQTGMCRGLFPSWYYNKYQGNCEEFNYGGCNGNQNRFATKELCEEGCVNNELTGTEVDVGYYTDDYSEEDYANINYTVVDKADDVVEISVDALPESDAVSLNPCDNYDYGCCDNSNLPSHGSRGEGCCLESQFGCCPDNIKPAGDRNMTGCQCDLSEFGCCPDQVTAKRSEDGDGCGCRNSEHGCCEDHYTKAEGPDKEGCPCHTFDFGCCADGETVAQGPNGEGCGGCKMSEYGCCPDEYTPQGEDGCDCSSSRFGCCPDAFSEAAGENFEGCAGKPGEMCSLKLDKGSCTKSGRAPQFNVRWHYNMKEGRCTRFWFEGCEGNANNFVDEESCKLNCVEPPGSGKCYLPSVKGYCSANEEKWYFDVKFTRCVPFGYSGCLGNANRFENKQECQTSCIRSDGLSICEQPVEAGPCQGDFSRWYYEETSGQCQEFVYGGCHGNRNRFMTKRECENSCRHDSVTKVATLQCKQPIEKGTCNQTLPRWAFHQENRQCKPFYFSGCNENTNNFESLDECEVKCPNSFPPEVQIINKVVNIEEGQSALLEITVKGNPFPEISWQHNHEVVTWDNRISTRDDHSVVINNAAKEDGGTWTVYAHGARKLIRKQISLSVVPSQIPLQAEILLEETHFPSGSEIQIVCAVNGFPIPKIKWLKNNAGLPRSPRITVDNGDTLTIGRASPVDGGTYTCKAYNEHEHATDKVQITVEQGKVPEQCTDRPNLADCALIVQSKVYCSTPGFSRICCKSCVESGQIAGPIL